MDYPLEGTAMALMCMKQWGIGAGEEAAAVPAGEEKAEEVEALPEMLSLRRQLSDSIRPDDTPLVNVAIARLHAAIPQNYRRALLHTKNVKKLQAAYMRTIYEVHEGSGSVAEIVGRHQIPESLEALLPPVQPWLFFLLYYFACDWLW